MRSYVARLFLYKATSENNSARNKTSITERNRNAEAASHVEPIEPVKLSSRLPAIAIETGSQAMEAINAINETDRRILFFRVSRSAAQEVLHKPIAVKALPNGKPPGRIICRYEAPENTEANANSANKSEATKAITRERFMRSNN